MADAAACADICPNSLSKSPPNNNEIRRDVKCKLSMAASADNYAQLFSINGPTASVSASFCSATAL